MESVTTHRGKADNRNCLSGGPDVELKTKFSNYSMFKNYMIINIFKGSYNYSDNQVESISR